MSRWFRWYEGTCEDGKFRAVARNANVTVATVMGVWASLLEDASNGEHRGIAERGFAFYAAVLDISEAEIERILAAMDLLKLISGGPDKIEITKWKERQFETDGADNTNAERQRRWREKQKQNADVTDRNGSVTAMKRPDTDTDTEKKDAAKAAPVVPSDEADFFRRIKQVCGRSSGGLGKQLLTAKDGNIALSRAAVEQASTKSDPREYIGAIIRGRGSTAEDLRNRGEAW